MLFPTLAKKRFVGPVSLDEYYARWARRHYYTTPNPSPALQPKIASRMVDDLHRELGVAWSWGGLYERRDRLWRGGYMARTRAYVHLGVDLNVPAGTPVCADCAGEVLRVDDDRSEGGWGTRVILRPYYHPIVLIYAHLSPKPVVPYGEALKAGDTVLQGQEFAVIGTPAHNGGWFPHLHLQALTPAAWEQYSRSLDELDGYGRAEDMASILARFPDPMRYVRLS